MIIYDPIQLQQKYSYKLDWEKIVPVCHSIGSRIKYNFQSEAEKLVQASLFAA